MSTPLSEKLQAEVGDIFRRVAYDLNIVNKLSLPHYESSADTTKIDEVTFVQLFENLSSTEILRYRFQRPLQEFFIWRAAKNRLTIDLFGRLEYYQYHLDLFVERDTSDIDKKRHLARKDIRDMLFSGDAPATEQEINDIRKELGEGNKINQQNSLLRSAYAIAQRKGKDTNWEAFENNLRTELLKQAGLTSSGGIVELSDEQLLLRTSCTPLTYRTVPQTAGNQQTKAPCKNCGERPICDFVGSDPCPRR